jgi:hypothetical protein
MDDSCHLCGHGHRRVDGDQVQDEFGALPAAQLADAVDHAVARKQPVVGAEHFGDPERLSAEVSTATTLVAAHSARNI